MGNYEYKIYDCDDRDLNNETLNEFGREGWELVAHNTVAIPIEEYSSSVWHYFSFRRPLVATEGICFDDDGGTTKEICYDDDGWTDEEWHEHQKIIAKLAREVRELLEQ